MIEGGLYLPWVLEDQRHGDLNRAHNTGLQGPISISTKTNACVGGGMVLRSM